MATGLPTVLGWFVHQWLWRGDSAMVSERAGDVAAVYESDDLSATRTILEKYKIEHIIIGTLERDSFKNLNQEKLLTMGRKVFDTAGTTIIELY